MENNKQNKKEIKNLKKQFRILKGWNIKYDSKNKLKGQSSININDRLFIIYGWPTNTVFDQPKDYILHEILHCVIKSYKEWDGNNFMDSMNKEEYLVQDICKLVEKGL